ncbi:class I SAM-dependent methyltransferase [Amycolatopsis minnesotensis]|uniref:Class I SAM-dependent methyltransferase n=1 Tax=Amycolatopsis minnesotensis TaxID=337894 RepID=A0ABN2QKK4_9PSEU
MTTQANDGKVLAMRMWRSMLATQELITCYLGVRLGCYEALATGPATAGELAERVGVAPRYAVEWLEQQAVIGILEVADATLPADERRYSLPAAHAEVLTVSDSPQSMAALALLPFGGVAAALPSLLEAFRTGGGVPDSVYGEDWRAGHGSANRAMFLHELPGWIEAFAPDVHAALSEPGATVADVACGSGWASIALATAYPELRVDGFDLDAEVLADAERETGARGLGERVRFFAMDAAKAEAAGDYDLVCLFDALHEISHPVRVLRTCRELRAEGGTVLVLDAKVAPEFTAPADEVERFQYGTSLLHCLPACLAEPGATGTGTVMRPGAVRRFAAEAGYAATVLLPVADRFHRLYRLVG